MPLSQQATGVVLLLGVVALWTASSFLTANILETADKPFLITWLCTASFSLYLIPPLVSHYWRRQAGKGKGKARASYVAISSHLDGFDAHGSRAIHGSPLTIRETANVACQFCFLWFAANYAMNISLALTSVSSVAILSATSALFTLIFGKMAGVEAFSLAKLAAVFMSIIGVAMVSRSDSDIAPVAIPAAHRHRLLGDALALTSAVLYGVYAVFLKVKIGNDSRVSMPIFFGFVGVFNIVCLWPFWVVLHLTGVETIEAPPNSRIWLSLLVNALITFISDYLYLLAMLKTSAVLATLALCLTIPTAVIADLARGTAVGNLALFIVGASLVASAFVIAGFNSEATASPPLLTDERFEGSEDVS